MKKIVYFILLILLMFFIIQSKEMDTKILLKNTKNSIVRVVSSNHMNYIATGVVIKNNYILTSSTILNHKYKNICVYDYDNKKYDVGLIGRDFVNSLTLLKFDQKNNFKELTISESYDIGETVYLVGAFYNRFPSVYMGIISSKSDNEILINAPSVPGMSGGAIFNSKGELIGILRGSFGINFFPNINILTQKLNRFNIKNRIRNDNLCYAIPISKVITRVEQMIKVGDLKKARLGVLLMNSFEGITIRVQKDSPADRAGLRDGDVIIKIDGKDIKDKSDIVNIINSKLPEDLVKITVLRSGKLKVFNVKLDRKTSDKVIGKDYSFDFSDLPKAYTFKFNFMYKPYLGVEIKAINSKFAKNMGIREGYGLLVLDVDEGSPAKKSGIREGDILLKANGIELKQIEDLEELLNETDKDQIINLEVYRNKKIINIKVKPDFEKNSFDFNYDKIYKKISDLKKSIGDSIIKDYNKKIVKFKRRINEMKKNKMVKREEIKRIKEKLLEVYKKYLDVIRQYQEKYEKELEELNKKYREILKEKEKISI